MPPENGIGIIDKQVDNLLQKGLRDLMLWMGINGVLAFVLKETYLRVHIVSNPCYAKTKQQ